MASYSAQNKATASTDQVQSKAKAKKRTKQNITTNRKSESYIERETNNTDDRHEVSTAVFLRINIPWHAVLRR